MMSMDPSSPVVCQIPDCSTTQAEIEAELRTFLSGFCSICKKDRGGKLCGCAFPCSLTFMAQMLTKIHDLLGIEKPPQRRAIQVCFKHPDLLKQAREACMAKREDRGRTSGGFTGGFGTNSPVNVTQDSPKRRRGRPRKVTAVTYATAVSPATSRPTLARTGETSEKMTNIQFGSTLSVGDHSIVVGDEDRLNEEDDPQEMEEEYVDMQDDSQEQGSNGEETRPMESENQKPQEVKMTKLKFTLGGDCSDEDDDVDESSEKDSDKENDRKVNEQRKRSAAGRHENDSAVESDSFDEEEEDDGDDSDVEFLCDDPPIHLQSSKKILKIQYENYGRAVLQQEMGSLARQSFLNDVSFICKNGGRVGANSFILSSMSPFLGRLLSDMPLVDSPKVILLPDIHQASMELFLSLVFNEKFAKTLDRRKMMRVKQVAGLLNIEVLLRSAKSKLSSGTKQIPPVSPRKPKTEYSQTIRSSTQVVKPGADLTASPSNLPVPDGGVPPETSVTTETEKTDAAVPSLGLTSPECVPTVYKESLNNKLTPSTPASNARQSRKQANQLERVVCTLTPDVEKVATELDDATGATKTGNKRKASSDVEVIVLEDDEDVAALSAASKIQKKPKGKIPIVAGVAAAAASSVAQTPSQGSAADSSEGFATTEEREDLSVTGTKLERGRPATQQAKESSKTKEKVDCEKSGVKTANASPQLEDSATEIATKDGSPGNHIKAKRPRKKEGKKKKQKKKSTDAKKVSDQKLKTAKEDSVKTDELHKIARSAAMAIDKSRSEKFATSEGAVGNTGTEGQEDDGKPSSVKPSFTLIEYSEDHPDRAKKTVTTTALVTETLVRQTDVLASIVASVDLNDTNVKDCCVKVRRLDTSEVDRFLIPGASTDAEECSEVKCATISSKRSRRSCDKS